MTKVSARFVFYPMNFYLMIWCTIILRFDEISYGWCVPYPSHGRDQWYWTVEMMSTCTTTPSTPRSMWQLYRILKLKKFIELKTNKCAGDCGCRAFDGNRNVGDFVTVRYQLCGKICAPVAEVISKFTEDECLEPRLVDDNLTKNVCIMCLFGHRHME